MKILAFLGGALFYLAFWRLAKYFSKNPKKPKKPEAAVELIKHPRTITKPSWFVVRGRLDKTKK